MKDQDPKGVSPRAHAEHVDVVEQFSAAMIAKLDANSEKGHWRETSVGYLLARLHEELIELRCAVGSGDRASIRDEAADVANFAMFIHDLYSDRERLP